MEIGPIAGIRLMPGLRSRPVDPELTAFADIESSARPEVDSYTGSEEKGADAEDAEDASGAQEVAVGTSLAARPPRRSVQAELPHTALTKGGM